MTKMDTYFSPLSEMGKNTHTTPGPAPINSQLSLTSRSILDLFTHKSSRNSRALTPASSYGSPEKGTRRCPREIQAPGSEADRKPVWLGNLHALAADIKASFTAAFTSAITDLREDIQSVGTRVAKVEADNYTQVRKLHHTSRVVAQHSHDYWI